MPRVPASRAPPAQASAASLSPLLGGTQPPSWQVSHLPQQQSGKRETLLCTVRQAHPGKYVGQCLAPGGPLGVVASATQPCPPAPTPWPLSPSLNTCSTFPPQDLRTGCCHSGLLSPETHQTPSHIVSESTRPGPPGPLFALLCSASSQTVCSTRTWDCLSTALSQAPHLALK